MYQMSLTGSRPVAAEETELTDAARGGIFLTKC